MENRANLNKNSDIVYLQVDGEMEVEEGEEDEEELDANAQEMLMQEYPSDCCPVRYCHWGQINYSIYINLFLSLPYILSADTQGATNA